MEGKGPPKSWEDASGHRPSSAVDLIHSMISIPNVNHESSADTQIDKIARRAVLYPRIGNKVRHSADLDDFQHFSGDFSLNSGLERLPSLPGHAVYSLSPDCAAKGGKA